MNPYTSLWTGVTPGDGPQTFHLVLLDAGRTKVLADPVGRDALRCIRCSACLNVCPVYERTGGHAYEHTYPGPIGAILAPQLEGIDVRPDLPFASSLCGACYEVCPVKIDIPSILVHLRGQAPKENAEQLAMRALARVFQHRPALRTRAEARPPRRQTVVPRQAHRVRPARTVARLARAPRPPGPLGAVVSRVVGEGARRRVSLAALFRERVED